jgi:hypothetical protein
VTSAVRQLFSARRVAILLVLAVVVYAFILGDRAWLLLRDGRPVFVLLGVGVLLLPVVGLWLVALELRFGRATERLGKELELDASAAADGQPSSPLPRRPSGRIDRAAADAVFAQRRAEVEAAPEDWRAWYHLAVAYGDAGDVARGRRAMRHAIALHDDRL